MALICVSFVHVTILDIWLILSGFILMTPVMIKINKLIWKTWNKSNLI